MGVIFNGCNSRSLSHRYVAHEILLTASKLRFQRTDNRVNVVDL